MKVRGFKTRVQLTEEQLEHVERKTRRSATPALAVLVWVSSMAVAAAIHFAWTPSATPEPGGSPDSGEPGSVHAGVEGLAGDDPADGAATPVDLEVDAAGAALKVSPAPPESSEEESAPPVAERTNPRDRTIRGSYAGSGRDWLAGW